VVGGGSPSAHARRLLDQIAGRIRDQFGIEHDLFTRRRGPRA
jgi:3-polyprenyl-4-hydroxybenzoate decarboxylase